MLTKLNISPKYRKQRGGFGIQILYPGLTRPQLKDSGMYTLGRIDHARVLPGTLIPMHPHRDDEILTYLRSGSVEHRDSEGHTSVVSNRHLMLMNAGASFYHEEKVREQTGVLEGLQIFIRPESGGLPPRVQFHTLEDVFSQDRWRKLAGPGGEYPLRLRSDTEIMDIRLNAAGQIRSPDPGSDGTVFLLYVFEGAVTVGDGLQLATGEGALLENEAVLITASKTSDLVLFVTRSDAGYFGAGMYSGNIRSEATG